MTISLSIIAAIFMTSGVLHLVKPALFMSIMPPWLPAPRALVLISGVCEMLGAIGILLQATRVSAAWGLIALLVAVFPANIQMLINAHERHMSTAWQAALVARLPLQVALIYWIHHVAIRSRR
ncbi:MAG: DoxX family protein [bacterium]